MIDDKLILKVQGLINMTIGGGTVFVAINDFLAYTEPLLRYLALLLGVCLTITGLYRFFKAELLEWRTKHKKK